MATISEMQEENPSVPFNASYDPSNPLGLLEKESDFLLKDTADKDIATAVTAAKKRLRQGKKKKEEEEKESLTPTEPNENVLPGEVPNEGNGLDLEKYSWEQNLKMIKIAIPLPSGTNLRSVRCDIKKNRLNVCLNGSHTIIDGSFFDAVKPDDCFWHLVDEKVIWVLLTKQEEYQWWKYCMKGEPEIDTKKVKRGSRLLLW